MKKDVLLMKTRWWIKVTISIALLLPLALQAQKDSAKRIGIDSFISKQPPLIRRLAQNLLADTAGEDKENSLQRNDEPYRRYKGRIIRHINISVLEFGVSITDTSKSSKNKLTRLADRLHRDTREYVIRKNLFFAKGQPLNPYLLADNERHLRDLDFLQDARITVKPVKGRPDSVDVTILAKDVLSIGGRFHMHNMGSATVQLREDNLSGWGNRISVSTLFDKERRSRLGTGLEYAARNISGTFIDGYAGALDFGNAFNSGREEEATAYVKLVKPLVTPFMKWTFAVEAATHRTANMYVSDSLYKSDFHYRYSNFDAWAAWNLSADKLGNKSRDDRLRMLVAFRFLQQNFQQVPLKYDSLYHFHYTDLTGLLGTVSVFRQNSFKTSYIYGFGRNEDVPEGIDISLTAGWTKKAGRDRPYLGVNYQRYFYTDQEKYFNYTVKAGTYLHRKKLQDMDVLFNIDYFSSLKQLSPRWKQRNFYSVGLTRQFRKELNEPLLLYSPFGLQEYKNIFFYGGNTRATLKAESVFYSPWSPLLFHIAPFVFGNLSYIKPLPEMQPNRKLFSSIGAGVRTRNESLVFGTVELKGYYFPGRNFYNQSWYFAFTTNVKFKYNRQLIKRPELITVN